MLLLVSFLRNKVEKNFYIDKPKIIFVTEEFITLSETVGKKGIRLCSLMSRSIIFPFLLQIENHISDIDNWVKVSFPFIWEEYTPLFLIYKEPFVQYPVEQ